jgi:hypothetical protein
MRYSVTVKRQEDVIPPGHSSRTSAVDPGPLGRGSCVSIVSRRPGLTLDEANDLVMAMVREKATVVMGDTYVQAVNAIESGGTVGPLPDGKLIVVEREGMG